MATCTFPVAIATYYRIVVASAHVISGSRQRSATATEDTAHTNAVANLVAAKVESILGPVGSFDDADISIGDTEALDIALRLMPIYVFNTFSLTKKGDAQTSFELLIEELENLNTSRSQEVGPVVKSPDNTRLNNQFKSSTWPSETES